LAAWDERHLVFDHINSHQTVANIDAGHVVVEVNAVDPIRRKGYRFKGPAGVHRAGALYRAGAAFVQGRAYWTQAGSRRSCSSTFPTLPQFSPSYEDGSTEHEIKQRFLALYDLHRTERRDKQGRLMLQLDHGRMPAARGLARPCGYVDCLRRI
jgi:hypothetical protein